MELSLVEPSQTIIGLNQEALDEWIEYRVEKKKKLSPLALKKVTNKLMKFPEEQQQLMVDTAIENDWQGLHEVDPPRGVDGNAANRLGQNTGRFDRKPTPAERVALAHEERYGRQPTGEPSDVDLVAAPVRDVSKPMGIVTGGRTLHHLDQGT